MSETIKRGSTGQNVARWQQIIGESTDGVFGKDTEAATKKWQAVRGLVADGIVGRETWAKAGVLQPAGAAPLGRVEKVPYGARVVDSLPFSMLGTRAGALEAARSLRHSPMPVEGVVVYTDVASREVCEAIVEAGLGLLAVTRAGEYNDGHQDELAWMRKVGFPEDASIAIDFEGLPAFEAGKKDPVKLAGLLKAWGDGVQAAGWDPGLYLGAPQPLTSKELDSLGMNWFWLGIGKPVDRTGVTIAYPSSGFCMRQGWHNEKNGMIWPGTSVLVDVNQVDFDHWGRRPSWVVKG